MALIKECMTSYGITASYWKIGLISIDRVRKDVNFVMYLFAEKGAKQPIDTRCVTDLMLNDDKTMYDKYFVDSDHLFTNIYNACYQYAKEHDPYFKDARDDQDYIEETESFTIDEEDIDSPMADKVADDIISETLAAKEGDVDGE